MKTKTLNLLWAVLLGVTLSACSGDDNGGTTTTPTTPTTPTPGSTATTVGNVDLTATRSTIAVGGELVTLTANVTDPGGTLPVVGRTVTFTASGASSTLSPASAETDDSGAASTTLTSGDVAGTVTVTATIAGVSGSVEVQINLGTPGPSFPSTGIPDQNSFSIAVDTLNPEGFDFDGESATVTVRLADHLNGTGVADGTLVRFSTEGGRIEPFCETSGGTCSVQWESSDPRPADGRSAILAWTLGNESFVDLDSDGVLNGNDVFDTADINDATPGNDVPEGFRDDNHNGVYDAASEEFPAEHPSSDDGIYNFGDNEYNGVSCETTTTTPAVVCSANQLVTIWEQGSIDVSASTTNAGNIVLEIDGTPTALGSTVDFATTPGTRLLFIVIGDRLGNRMPFGTTVSFNVNNGDMDPSSVTIPSGTGPFGFFATLDADQTGGETGAITVRTETPNGVVSGPFSFLTVID